MTAPLSRRAFLAASALAACDTGPLAPAHEAIDLEASYPLPEWARGHGRLEVPRGKGPIQRALDAGEPTILLGEGDYEESVVIPAGYMGTVQGAGGFWQTRLRAPWYVEAGSQPTLAGVSFVGAPLYWLSGYWGLLHRVHIAGPGASLNIGLLPQGGRPEPYPDTWPTSRYPSRLTLSECYVGASEEGPADHVRILASDVHWLGGACERVREGLWWSTWGDIGVGACRSVRFEADDRMPITMWGADQLRFRDCLYYRCDLVIRANCTPSSGFGAEPALYDSTLTDQRRRAA